MGRYYGGSNIQFGPQITPAVKQLIIINVVVFVLQYLSRRALGGDYLSIIFGVNYYGVIRGMIWQPVTYMFLHGTPWHLALNMFILWMFGSSIEQAWGPREFLKFYFFTGVMAGLLSLAVTIGQNVVTIGASGAIFGLLVAFGMLYPDRIILAFFIFPMRAKNFVLLLAALELMMTLEAGDPNANNIARGAHIGGMLFGYLYLKFGDRVRRSLPRLRFNARSGRKKKVDDWNGFMQNEVDPILDKIGREGIHSLTRKERRILKKARGRRNVG